MQMLRHGHYDHGVRLVGGDDLPKPPFDISDALAHPQSLRGALPIVLAPSALPDTTGRLTIGFIDRMYVHDHRFQHRGYALMLEVCVMRLPG